MDKEVTILMKLIKYILNQIIKGIDGSFPNLLQIGFYFSFSFYILSCAAIELIYVKVFLELFGWIVSLGLMVLMIGMSVFYYQIGIKSWRIWKSK
jgi:hypothetical protein